VNGTGLHGRYDRAGSGVGRSGTVRVHATLFTGRPPDDPGKVPPLAPVCANCGAGEFVWVNDIKTGSIGGGTLSLRSRGELSLGTRICSACGHADLFLKDPAILRMPHTWRPGEFIPIPARPAAPAAPRPPSAPPPASPPTVTASHSPATTAAAPPPVTPPPAPLPPPQEPPTSVPAPLPLPPSEASPSTDEAGPDSSPARKRPPRRRAPKAKPGESPSPEGP